MFKDVVTMNEAFGSEKGDPKDIQWVRVRAQADNILDEYEELLEALKRQDITETRDALCDILVFTLGAYHFIGHDADEDMRVVYESNMSKFCKTQQEVWDTQQYYFDLGIETYTGGELPAMWVKSVKQQKDKYGKNYPQGKFLKCVNWKEPEFK